MGTINYAELQQDILNTLVKQVTPVNFKNLAYPEAKLLQKQLAGCAPDSDVAQSIQKKLLKMKVNEKHYVIFTIEEIARLAEKNDWGLCRNQNEIYLYNRMFWSRLDVDAFQKFLLKASERMGVPIVSSKYYQFGKKLFEQFMMQSYLQSPAANSNVVLINLLNGTYEIRNGQGKLRKFCKDDFLTHQLPFEYNPDAAAPLFDKYLSKVQPDESARKVLAEYIGYLFIKTGNTILKEEKALMLYGGGANGKSVFFEIVNALLGAENVICHSLQDLTDGSGYYRAQLANKLVNYASEINGKLESSIFKQLVSGEPVSARLPYGKPFHLTQYARLVFNCNELPRGNEFTDAYFRRFLIVPFDVTIPPEEQIKDLHSRIIENELAGVFNWVLRGLARLLKQNGFTECIAARRAVEDYRLQSDSLRQFLNDERYKSDVNVKTKIVDLYIEYKCYCQENGFYHLTKPNFIKRLKSYGIQVSTINVGNVAYLKKHNSDEE